MKKLAFAAVLAVLAGPALAGGLAEPVMPPDEVAVQTRSSSSGIIIPLLILILIAVAVASSGGDDATDVAQ